jgi:hypothetical protein
LATPQRSSYVLIVEVTTKVGVFSTSLPPSSNHKGYPRFPLRIQGWYKHFGVPSQVEQHGQPRRTPSQLGFQEPKSNKHKPSQLRGEPSAQDANRCFPLSNLFSLLKSCKGLDLGAKRKERVSQCLGAVCLKVGRSKWHG